MKNYRLTDKIIITIFRSKLFVHAYEAAYVYGTVTLLCMFECYKNTYLYNKGHTILSWSHQEIKELDYKDANLALSNAFFFKYLIFVRVCLLMPCGNLLGKGWPLGSPL